MAKPNSKLTGKQQKFIAEYLVDGDGANAARRAGYASSSAKVTACELLKRADIQQALTAEKALIPNRGLTETYGTIADVRERREILSRHLRAATSEVAAAKVADVLNRMDGIYIQKHEVTHRTKPDLSKLDESELATLEQMLSKAVPVAIEAVH